jgi:uncharacterized protein DUF6766
VPRFLRENGLSIAFGILFLTALGLQALAGHNEFNNNEVAHAALTGNAADTISFGRYLTSSNFGQAVMENWQSEYLQFSLFILGTIWLIQRGSPESKEPGRSGRESDKDQLLGEHAKHGSPRWARVGGVRRFLYSNSLLLVMAVIFFGSWFGQSVTGWTDYNAEQVEHEQPKLSWTGYLGSADFWQTTLQNWQSEFLAVGSMAILSVYLRQRGSPESKPVGAPHHATSVEG